MIRHTVLLSLDGADEKTISTVIAELRALPPLIAEIAAYSVERDLGLQDGNADVVIVGDFASVEDYRAYSAHPAHVRVINDHIRPHMTGLLRAQVDLE
jgi:Stress responsive A/B Barrel Domain